MDRVFFGPRDRRRLEDLRYALVDVVRFLIGIDPAAVQDAVIIGRETSDLDVDFSLLVFHFDPSLKSDLR